MKRKISSKRKVLAEVERWVCYHDDPEIEGLCGAYFDDSDMDAESTLKRLRDHVRATGHMVSVELNYLPAEEEE